MYGGSVIFTSSMAPVIILPFTLTPVACGILVGATGAAMLIAGMTVALKDTGSIPGLMTSILGGAN